MSVLGERPTIVVTGRIPQSGLDLLHAVGDVWMWDGDDPIPLQIRSERLADADAVVTLLSDRVDDEFLAGAPALRVVANVAVGFDNIDVAACTSRGVRATNTPGVLTDATADLTMGLILGVTRRIGEGDRLVRSGRPWRWGMFMMLGAGLQGRRLGIIGLGGIGQAVARRAAAFDMEIVYHSRSAVDPSIEARLGTSRVELDELLATSDVVSVHCPHSADTHHLLDSDAFEKMRTDAWLINTARGAIVDEDALVDALRAGSIAGAGLDVYENEPVVHPGLTSLENVLLVPHLGSATYETRGAMSVLAARNVVAVLAGDEPPTPLN